MPDECEPSQYLNTRYSRLSGQGQSARFNQTFINASSEFNGSYGDDRAGQSRYRPKVLLAARLPQRPNGDPRERPPMPRCGHRGRSARLYSSDRPMPCCRLFQGLGSMPAPADRLAGSWGPRGWTGQNGAGDYRAWRFFGSIERTAGRAPTPPWRGTAVFGHPFHLLRCLFANLPRSRPPSLSRQLPSLPTADQLAGRAGRDRLAVLYCRLARQTIRFA